jgi:hypothetical protein
VLRRCQNNSDTSTDLSPCYNANVVWTTTGTAQPGGANYRPCDTPQLPADDDATPVFFALNWMLA